MNTEGITAGTVVLWSYPVIFLVRPSPLSLLLPPSPLPCATAVWARGGVTAGMVVL